MRWLRNILMILCLSSINALGQDSNVEVEAYNFDSPKPRFKETELIKEIQEIYSDCSYNVTFYLRIYIDKLGIPIRIETNDSVRQLLLSKILDEYDNWIAGRKNFQFAETFYTYEIKCKENKVKVEPILVTRKLQKREIIYFDFYKGITTSSSDHVKPFNDYSINKYLKDSLDLTSIPANRYRAKSRSNNIKITIDSKIIKSNSCILIYLKKENKLVKIEKDQNFIYLPENSEIDFLAISRNKGLMVYGSYSLTGNLLITDLWTEATYDKLGKIFKSW